MAVVVAYKWAPNPQDASVGADGVVDWSRAKAAISEYDPVAVEVGRTVAAAQGTEVVGVSVGTEATGSSMAKKGAMSRGLARGLVVADDVTAGWNATQVAAALAALVRRVAGADLVVTGDASVDEGARMMSALVAGHLGWSCFQDVVAVAKAGSGYEVTQAVPGGTRTIAVSGPVVVAVTTDAVRPTVPGMKEIMAAGKKVVDVVPVAELDLPQVDAAVTHRARPPRKARKNQILPGDPTEAATALATALRAAGTL